MDREQIGILTLTRKPGQSVLIGDNVEVEVVRTTSGRAVLRISAPRSIRISRKQDERKEAA